MYSNINVQWNLTKFLYAKNPFLASKGKETPSIDGAGLGTLVDIDSIFYTSVQGTYFNQVIIGTTFEFFWEPKQP